MDKLEEVAADSYAFSEFDIDGKPNPLLSEIAVKYLKGEISREIYKEKMMETVMFLENQKNNNK